MRSAPSRGLPYFVEAILAFGALLLLLPLLILLALAVGLSSQGGVFYRQIRVGREGREFILLKFRSMRPETGQSITVAGDARITPVGRLLRATKLDELPEFWNVLRGDLALVGPRPEVPNYVDREDPLWKEVLRTKPGLTHPITLRLQDEEGLLATRRDDAETFYRQRLLPWKLRGYLAYEQERTVWSDLGVLVKTALQLLPGGKVSPPAWEDLADV